MTATYFILLDLKSRNKPIRLFPHPSQAIHARSIDNHSQEPVSSIPANLLREKNQDASARSRATHRTPYPPADLLIISQQDKSHLPPNNIKKPTVTINSENKKNRYHKTPNKENLELLQPKRSDRTTPNIKFIDLHFVKHKFQL